MPVRTPKPGVVDVYTAEQIEAMAKEKPAASSTGSKNVNENIGGPTEENYGGQQNSA